MRIIENDSSKVDLRLEDHNSKIITVTQFPSQDISPES